MYLQHFGLQEFPFRLTPDTSYFYCHRSQAEAIDVLLIALAAGEGFLKITGEVGTGKTMLCRKLLGILDGKPCVTAYIPDPFLSPIELRLAIASELGIDLKKAGGQHQLMHQITLKLIALRKQGNSVVLLIDEAQSMPIETLETLRLITNLETEKDKLIQIVLFGQPELDELLNQKEIRQLKQRISFSYRLAPMDMHSIRQYIQHRLGVAGCHRDSVFSRSGLALITKASRGIPRLVNVLSHKALIMAYGQGKTRVSKRQILAAIRDTEDTQTFMPTSYWRISALIGLAFAAALLVAMDIGRIL